MQVLKLYWREFIILFLICGCIFMGNRIGNYDHLTTSLSFQKDSFKTKLDNLGNKYGEQSVNIISEREAKDEALFIKDKEIRKLQSEVKIIETAFIHDTTLLYYGDTIIRFKDKLDTLHKLNFKNQWIEIKAFSDNNKFIIDTIGFHHEISVVIGLKKESGLKNIFKKEVPVVLFQDKNPYSSITDMNNITVHYDKSWYQTNTFYFVGGIVATVIAYKIIR